MTLIWEEKTANDAEVENERVFAAKTIPTENYTRSTENMKLDRTIFKIQVVR